MENQLHPTRREVLGGLGAVSAIALSGCAPRGVASAGPAPDAAALLDQVFWNLIEHEPGTATGLGVDTGDHSQLRYRLGDASAEGLEKLKATLTADLARVRAMEAAPLDASTRTSLEVIESAYSTALEGMQLPYGDIPVGSWRTAPYIVIQNAGSYLDVPRFLSTDHPVRDANDAQAYLSRLHDFAAILDGERERMEAAGAIGLNPPDFLLDKALPQLESSLADARSGGTLVNGLTDRTGEIPGDWDKAAREIVSGKVVPAYERQLAELRKQRARAGSNPSIRAQPQGEEWYAWSLKSSTTTPMTAEEIHQMGLTQLDEIHARMDTILQGIGYAQGSVGARMTALADDPRYKFAPDDPGRAEIMEFIQDRIAWIRAQMPRAFRKLARGNLEVHRLPPAEEPGAPGAYGGSGSIDGTIPGKMWINLLTTDLHRKYDLPTLTHHETIPGHVWEGEYSNRLPPIRSRLAFNAFSEGWALYAEQLADELGAYDENPAWRLGYLQSQAFRACRLVVDTGLHAKGWSREQGVRFFVERNGDNPDSVRSEVDRYCSWPGQATGYKVGHSEIVRQRSRAAQALGNAYDLRDFNQAVVDGGNVPLDVLARNIDRYIESARG
jgi:uncharacterized protein (DUF885 family)